MIVGVGIDVVDVARFVQSIERTPTLLQRLFTAAERDVQRPERLAARFAAKEALAKALGAPPGLRWQDAEVRTADDGSPHLELRGTVADAAAERGAAGCHISLSHDGGMAIAVVILEAAR